ncbi:MAG: heavy metal translocating P-type ATPase [Devosia sp.]
MTTLLRYREMALVVIALLGLAAGGVLWATGSGQSAQIAWTVATIPVLLALGVEIYNALRRGDVGLDIVAALSMSFALWFNEPLAANVVALMYSGGQLLERFAEGRARREMTALLGRVARTAMIERDGALSEIAIEAIRPGDVLLIRQGEVLPVDGRVAEGNEAFLDPSALTGESLPQRVSGGGVVQSGATASGASFRLVAERPAAESTYAQIVKLVEAAQKSKAPMTRLADRYAMGFLILTLVIAGAAWALSGTHLRALAVLVVATPCPLILAVPVALMSGISRAAKSGVLVKDGGMFEALAQVRTAILDKTGTLTHGDAEIADIITAPGFSADEVLRYAASLDQASGHPIAATLVAGARVRGLKLASPVSPREHPGDGIEGMIDDVRVAVGGDRYVSELTGEDSFALHTARVATATVAVAIGGRIAGVIVLEDKVRADAASLIGELRAAGVKKIIIASGDRSTITKAVGDGIGVDELYGEMSASAKVDLVKREAANAPTMMVGDGINDAPALAAATVGAAMGARGATASSQSAGVVVLVDALEPLVRAMATARRSLRIALESVWIGLGLSIGAMIVAAFGYLPPVQGALLQEAIDVAVILNALRALR